MKKISFLISSSCIALFVGNPLVFFGSAFACAWSKNIYCELAQGISFFATGIGFIFYIISRKYKKIGKKDLGVLYASIALVILLIPVIFVIIFQSKI